MNFKIFPVANEFLCIIICCGQHGKISNKSGYMQYEYHVQNNLQVSTCNLSKHQDGVYCTGIKLFSNLPPTIKYSKHCMKLLKPAIKEYLLPHSFYSVENLSNLEILNYKYT
jgi:hypothetical protein